GATLTVDDNGNGNTTSVNLASRVGDTANVTLNAGTLNFLANPGTGIAGLTTTEQVGTLTLGPGSSTVQAGFSTTPALGTTSALTFGSLIRNAGATVNFVGNTGGGVNAVLGSGYNRVVFSTAPTTTGSNGGILPYAVVSNALSTGADFATYDFGNNTVAAFTGYATSLAAAGPNDTVKLSGAETLSGNDTVNALLLVGGTVGLGGNTLTVTSGGLAVTAPTSGAATGTVIGGTLAFGSAEGVVNTANSTGTVQAATLVLNSTVTGSNGLTVGGNGTNTLPNANSVSGVNAVQTLTFGADITGGTFKLTFNGQQTGPITWSSTASTLVANIQAAL